MNKDIVAKAVFFRHGETLYTGKFPDLTDEGKTNIARSAEVIKGMILTEKPGLIHFFSSPAPRSMGSISIVRETLGSTGCIQQAWLLRQAGVYDKEAGQAIFDEHFATGGMPAVSRAYIIDPRFEDPNIFEPRRQVIQRGYDFFNNLIRNIVCGRFTRFAICASHYETLFYLPTTLFLSEEDPPLTFGELIVMSVQKESDPDRVSVLVEFRGKSAKIPWPLSP